MGTLAGFAPWIVYWVLAGNVPSVVAALLAVLLAGGSLLIGRVTRTPGYAIEFGSVTTFFVLTVVGALGGGSILDAWGPAVSYVGLLATAVVGAVADVPLVREFALVGPATDPSRSDEFVPMRAAATRVWVGAAAVMTVSAAVAAIASGRAVVPSRSVVDAIGTWVIPVVVFCAAAITSRVLYERAVIAAASPGVVRRTSFVAFRELAIDELYYLAREKVEREVGAGMEAYDVNVGSAGTPLTGDESRESWAATYKVRERR